MGSATHASEYVSEPTQTPRNSSIAVKGRPNPFRKDPRKSRKSVSDGLEFVGVCVVGTPGFEPGVRITLESPTDQPGGVTSSVTRMAAKQGTPEQNLSSPRDREDEPACTEWPGLSGEMAVGGGIEPPTFRLTAGRCTNSTTPQKAAFSFRLAIKIRPSRNTRWADERGSNT